MIGESIPYAQTEVERMIVDALTADDRVTDVEIRSIKRISPDTLEVKGICSTVYGDIDIDTEVSLIES